MQAALVNNIMKDSEHSEEHNPVFPFPHPNDDFGLDFEIMGDGWELDGDLGKWETEQGVGGMIDIPSSFNLEDFLWKKMIDISLAKTSYP